MSIYTSVLTAGTNSHQETSENINAVATDFVSQGVVGAITNTAGVAPSTGAYAVNAQGTPDMTVAVSSGIGYVTATPASQDSQALRVRNTASANVTISANSSGSTKYDWIYINVDATKAANPAADASDVATLVVSRSSSNATDNGTPPTYGYCIAMVTVANGASSITNGNIADERVNASTAPGAWQPWTPAFTNITVGNGSLTGKYTQIGKTVIGTAIFQSGTTTGYIGAGATYQITLPVAIAAPGTFQKGGRLSVYEGSTGVVYDGVMQFASTTNAYLLASFNGAAINTLNIMKAATSTNFTPSNSGSGSYWEFNFMYQAA